MKIRILQNWECPYAIQVAWNVYHISMETSMSVTAKTYFEQYANVQNLMNLVNSQKLIMWGAFENEQLVGMSAFQMDGHITMLYVYPNFWRRGIGKKLLRSMRVYAGSVYKFTKVSVSALPNTTTEFFKKQGFSTLCEYPDFTVLEAASIKEIQYPVKKIKPVTYIIVFTVAILFILFIIFWFLSGYIDTL